MEDKKQRASRAIHQHLEIRENKGGDTDVNLYPALTHQTRRRVTTRSQWSSTFFVFAMTFALACALTMPARADVCVQLTGGPFSGDLGFFRFKGALPKGTGVVVALKGRVAGLSPVFGTATVAKDGTFVEIGATFFADGTQGQIDVSFFPPTASAGSGGGDYGVYGAGQAVTANIVACTLEP